MLKILAIDTSTDACSAALLVNHKIIDRLMVAPREHTNFILPMVNDLLVAGQLKLEQLDAIAFGSGPGSFTGVRLAASIVQGFAFAANIAVVRVSTLRALAQGVFVEFRFPKVVVAQDAIMKEIYWGEYQVDDEGIMQAIKPELLIDPSKISEIPDQGFVAVGSGFEVYQDIFSKKLMLPVIAKKQLQVEYILQLAAADFLKGLTVSAKEALPIYLREKVV